MDITVEEDGGVAVEPVPPPAPFTITGVAIELDIGEGAADEEGVIGAGVGTADGVLKPRAREKSSATCDLIASLSVSALGEVKWNVYFRLLGS